MKFTVMDSNLFQESSYKLVSAGFFIRKGVFCELILEDTRKVDIFCLNLNCLYILNFQQTFSFLGRSLFQNKKKSVGPQMIIDRPEIEREHFITFR